MVDPAHAPRPRRDPETVADIAERTGRPLSTVRNTWARHPDWPAHVGRRGRWVAYDPDDIDQWLAANVDRQAVTLEPARLYTARELEASGIGITAATIRADLSRGRWPAPDNTEGGTNRWTGATASAAIEGRRRYRRTDS
ncbi:hypothetical protein WB388_08685 [Streptomyces brasiliscabiei]|uniref:Helix-turn-helix domain-containing protein n=1 Tax=Streptomyces brasiliscabiei TaxID=2736302 RepID=A0ABU8G9S8_9ACTN